MTVDLDMMLDLRDLQVARDVQRRAEMGWFDVEFTMYGCAYYQNGERYYRVSAHDEKIYDFIENEQNLASDMYMLSRRYPVPTGMQEYIAVDIKKELAKEMAEAFPMEFFVMLEDLAKKAEESTAFGYLQDEMNKIEGTFDSKRLKRLHEESWYAYFRRKIAHEEYQQIKKWLHDEERSMEENVVAKDIFEKTFYAFAYEDNGQIKYVVNAGKGHIYQRKNELEKQGFFIAPLYENTCYYNYDVRLPEVRRIFEAEMHENLSTEYVRKMKDIYTKNTHIPTKEFAEYVCETREKYGEKAVETLRHYGVRWGII